MSLLVTFNGSNYIIPTTGEVGWGSNMDSYLVAIAAGCLQKTGGSFTLSAETDFGAAFGLKSLYYKSRSSNVAASGILRLNNNADAISWRNFGNSTDLSLTVNTSDQLSFNGTPIGGTGLFTPSRAIVSNGSGDLSVSPVTSVELGYVSGVTSAIQTQFSTKKTIATGNAYRFETTDASGNLQETPVTALRAIATDANGLPVASSTTATELGYVSGVTSAIQTQLGTKFDTAGTGLSSSGTTLNISTVPVANGGTGQTSYTNGQILIGNTTGNTLVKTNLTGTSNQVIVTNGAGSITLSTPQNLDTSANVQFGTLGLGSTSDSSALATLTSTAKGFLTPRMTQTQRDAIATPATGLMIFNTTSTQFNFYDGSAWQILSVGGGSGTVSAGTQYQFGYYATNGITISGNANWITNASNQLLGIDGTSSAPAYSFSTDPDTGLYHAGTNVCAIATAGAYRASVDASGKFLINTATARSIGSVSHTAQIEGTSSASSSLSITKNTADAAGAYLSLAKSRGTSTGSVTIVQNGDSLGDLYFFGADGTDTNSYGARISTFVDNTPGTAIMPGRLVFYTTSAASSSAIERMRLSSIGQMLMTSLGSASTPDYSFLGDTNTGFRTFGADSLALTTGGTDRFYVTNTAVTVDPTLAINNGAVGTPSLSFQGDSDTGMFHDAGNRIQFTCGGAEVLRLGTTQLSTSLVFVATDGSVSSPAFQGQTSSNTGMYFLSSNRIGLASNGGNVATFASTGVAIKGTTTNDSAAAGFVGETISSSVTGVALFTSANFGDLTSISLTAGDWLIDGCGAIVGASVTATGMSIGISTTSGNSATGLTSGDNYLRVPSTALSSGDGTSIPPYRVSLASTTTYYLKVVNFYVGGTQTLQGRITAIRMR